MATRAIRPVYLHAAVLACVVSATPASPAAAQPPAPLARARQAVVPIAVHDASGATIATGSGFFIDIGKLVAPRPLLAMGAVAGVVIGGLERRTTAVLAEDRQAGIVLVAVDLPDGAPPALAVERRAATSTVTGQALDASGAALEVTLGPAAEVAGIGLVHRLGPGVAIETGSAVVNAQGELIGAAVSTESAPGERVTYVVPAARLLAMPRTAPLPVLEWALQARAGRSPDGVRACARGAAAALAGRLDDAAAAYEAAVEVNPADADAWNALGACFRAQHDKDASIGAWQRAAAAQPANPRFQHELALDLSDAGRHDQALTAFAEVVRLRPRDAEAQFNLGVAYSQVRRLEDEVVAYHAALALDPSHVRALRNLGVSCLALNRGDDAVASFFRASQLAPADPEVRTGLGLSYLSLRRFGEAIDALRQALKIAPGLVKAQFGLGVAYFANGDRVAAQSQCQALKAVDPQKGEQLCRIVDGR